MGSKPSKGKPKPKPKPQKPRSDYPPPVGITRPPGDKQPLNRVVRV